MKTILSGGWGYGNMGDEAILFCTMNLLKIYNKKKENDIIVTTYNPKQTSSFIKSECIYSLHYILYNDKIKCRQIVIELEDWLNKNGKITNENLVKYIGKFKEANRFIMAGGGYYNDIWYDNFLAHNLEIRIANKLGVKVLLLNQTLGPINNKKNRLIFSKLAESIDFINVRDKQSMDLINSLIDEEVELSGDVVNAISIFKQRYKYDSKPQIGIMIQHYRPYTNIEDSNLKLTIKKYFYKFINKEKSYIKKLKKIVETVGNNIDCEFKFISSKDWDVDICKQVSESLNSNIKSTFSFSYDVNEFISSISSCDLMFSTNMHPIIIASSYRIPSVAISYFYKIDDYMDSIGMSDYTHNIQNFDENKIIKQILCLLKNPSKGNIIFDKVNLINRKLINLYEEI